MPRFLKKPPAWAGALLVLYAAARWLLGVLALPDPAAPLPPGSHATYLLAFTAFFLPLLYLLPCALAGRWLKPDLRTLLLYAGTAYFFGAGLELVMDRLFVLVLGRPCYLYFIWPLHGGHTSGTGLVVWPLYGFFVALVHQSVHGTAARTALLAVDAMVLEVAANVFSLVFFGSWLFRYHAADLHHFTTVEAFPIYLLGGYPGVLLLKAWEQHPRRGWLGGVLWLLIMALVFLP